MRSELEPEYGRPLIYSSRLGYNWDLIAVDEAFIIFRVLLSLINVSFFCPYQFEFFIGQFPDYIFLRNEHFLFARDLVNIFIEFTTLFFSSIQTLISIWTYNPIILGLNIGELFG